MVEAAHLLLLEPDAVSVAVQPVEEGGLLLPEDVLSERLLLVTVPVGRLLLEAGGVAARHALRGTNLLSVKIKRRIIKRSQRKRRHVVVIE